MGDQLGELMGTNSAARDASGIQAGSVGRANDVLKEQYNQGNIALQNSHQEQQGYMSPYSQAGLSSLSQLQSGDFAKNLQMDPGYQFRLDEGKKAVEGSAAARGGLNSGATLKALERFGQNFASNEYQNAYQRDYARLSQLAGLGFNAGQNQFNAAGNYGNQLNQNLIGYGQGVSGNLTGLGNAQAAARVGAANANAGLLGQLGGAAILGISCDERLKTNIEPIDKDDLKEMKSFLKAYSFRYKSSEYGSGEHVGIMAQDLEKSKLGKTLVVTNEKGHKMIDLKRVLMMFLATIAEA